MTQGSGRDYRDPDVLRDEVAAIMDFYHPRCMDHERGGYINQLTDDGTVFDRDTKHLVGTCRFIFNFAQSASLLRRPEYLDCARHGLDFLREGHRQPDGGYAWVIGKSSRVVDGTRHCYGHAFVLLAAAAAAHAKVQGAAELVTDTFDLLESRFWEERHGLYVDEIAASDWKAVGPYRGQNANMHMCDAMYWAAKATGDDRFLDRAILLARRICVELASGTDGRVWEHYTQDWQHDFDYNKDDPKHLFRPYGYLPGHFVEWAKILLALERMRAEEWMLPTACKLFDDAMEMCWDHERGGINYTFSPDGDILDTDRYYWVLAESAAAAASLGQRTGDEAYWQWYDRIWDYADRHFIDHERGGWYRVLDQEGSKYDDKKSPPAKTDYHPLAACIEIIEVTGAD